MAKKKITITDEDIAKLTLMDDIFMGFVFKGNIPATERLLRTILGRDDIHVVSSDCQKPIDGDEIGDRGIRIDILATDDDGQRYDIEIQKKKEGASPQRARFNSARMDSEMLGQGQKFTDIAESYVIFITEDDYYGEGLPKYTIDRVVRNSKVPDHVFGDGAHIIYVNGQYRDETDEIGKLMHDFHCMNGDDMYFPELKDSTNKYKNPEGGKNFMEELIREYLKEAIDEEMAETVIALYLDGDSPEKIARCTRRSVEEVNAIIAAHIKAKAATA